jgi:hypothetical protein
VREIVYRTAGRSALPFLLDRMTFAERGVFYVPVPDSSIAIGFDDALSLMVTVPDFAPCDFGEKVMLMVQFAPAVMALPQLEVMPNWPETFIDEIFNSVLPVLVK